MSQILLVWAVVVRVSIELIQDLTNNRFRSRTIMDEWIPKVREDKCRVIITIKPPTRLPVDARLEHSSIILTAIRKNAPLNLAWAV